VERRECLMDLSESGYCLLRELILGYLDERR
jgi:hypothetical protein